MSRRRKKEGRAPEGIDYWKSSSDLMTALILVLLLVIMFLILYILEMPDKEFDQELKYDQITEEQDANGESLKTSDKTSHKETDQDGGDRDGKGESDDDDDDNGNGNGNGNGNDSGTGKDDPGEGDGSKSAVLASLVDGETGKAIPAKDVTFELYSDSKALTVLNTYYPVKKSYRTYKTTEDGTFYLPEKVLATSYYFHQLSDFRGYDVADKVEFTIDGAYDWPDPFLVKIPMYPLRDVVRIQIPIRLLRTDRLRNSLIRGRLKRLVRVPPQGKGDPFQPFVQIAVLENETAKGPLFLSGCHPEIAHAVAGLRLRDPVI